MSKKINNQEIEELEREFEKKLIGHIKPIVLMNQNGSHTMNLLKR